jgi:TolB-like protein/Tfp pilus assembly protein PilF
MDLSNANWTKAQDIKINDCLAKILLSPMFAKAERQQRFLNYIIAETLEGRAEKLKGYTIGLEVFDREPSFDPAIDAIVRVEAARLRAKLREYYDSEGSTDPLRFELPKGNYAIHIEWRQKAATQEHRAITTSHPQLVEDKPSLAVLPLTNMSCNQDQEYFADGFTDCLITEVSRISGLFVISRQSSFIYKGVVKRSEAIGVELGVRYLLEGSIQRSGKLVRITAQLIDAVSGAHVWADHYDRELKDIFSLQDDVTRCIVTVLKVQLAHNEIDRFGHEGTVSPEAHDSLLRGLERFWLYTPETTEQAKLHFSCAVELDPDYAAAHVWLARSVVFQWIFLWDLRDEALEQALEHVRIAIDLDPQHSNAYSALCWVQCWRKQGESSLEAGRRAVALDPNNADAYLFLAMILAALGRGEEALNYIKTGLRLNPLPSSFYQAALGFCYYSQEKYEEAIAAYKRGAEVTDAFIPNHVWLCLIYKLLGRESEARIEREKVLALSGGRKPAVRHIFLDETLSARTQELIQLTGLA